MSGFTGRAVSSPLVQSLKLGLETFSTTFPADNTRNDVGGSTQPRNVCGFLVDTYRKQCLEIDFTGNPASTQQDTVCCFGYGSLLKKGSFSYGR